MRHSLLAACSILALSATAASAADMAVRPVALPPPPSWTGFYIGIMGGGAWGDGSITGATGTIDLSGGFIGGTVGYNWQNGNIVWGIEGDAAWASIGKSSSATVAGVLLTAKTDADFLATIRGRVGVVAGNGLYYITGGGAWMHNEMSLSAAAGGIVVGVSSANTHSGWTIGGGGEWMLQPNWTVKLEYLYMDFDAKTYFSGTAGAFGADAQLHTVKLGLNYKF